MTLRSGNANCLIQTGHFVMLWPDIFQMKWSEFVIFTERFVLCMTVKPWPWVSLWNTLSKMILSL